MAESILTRLLTSSDGSGDLREAIQRVDHSLKSPDAKGAAVMAHLGHFLSLTVALAPSEPLKAYALTTVVFCLIERAADHPEESMLDNELIVRCLQTKEKEEEQQQQPIVASTKRSCPINLMAYKAAKNSSTPAHLEFNPWHVQSNISRVVGACKSLVHRFPAAVKFEDLDFLASFLAREIQYELVSQTRQNVRLCTASAFDRSLSLIICRSSMSTWTANTARYVRSYKPEKLPRYLREALYIVLTCYAQLIDDFVTKPVDNVQMAIHECFMQ